MSFIYHDGSVVLLLEFNDLWQFCKVTFHGEETVGNNQLDGIWTAAFQFSLQILHVVVLVMEECGNGEAASIYDRCVVAVVTKYVVITSCKARHNTRVHSETCRKNECFVFADEFSEFLLQLDMNIECSVQETRTCASSTILFGCIHCSSCRSWSLLYPDGCRFRGNKDRCPLPCTSAVPYTYSIFLVINP